MCNNMVSTLADSFVCKTILKNITSVNSRDLTWEAVWVDSMILPVRGDWEIVYIDWKEVCFMTFGLEA